jgi:hypothetical protein
MSDKRPKPTEITYEALTAFINGVNLAARRLDMRAGITRACEKCRGKK